MEEEVGGGLGGRAGRCDYGSMVREIQRSSLCRWRMGAMGIWVVS